MGRRGRIPEALRSHRRRATGDRSGAHGRGRRRTLRRKDRSSSVYSQTCEDEGIRPDEVLRVYAYSKRRPEPTQEALEAVQDVFDFGIVATTEPIKYFYAPALVDSEWHESQIYVMTINGHRFFKEATE